MERYTILTYIFGDYERLREPRVVSEDCDYVCVTDNHGLRSDVWRFVYVEDLMPHYREGWAKAYWAKNTFLDYVVTDIVIRIDGSVEVLDDCGKVVEDFVRGGYDLAVMTHPMRSDAFTEYDAWERFRGLSGECREYYRGVCEGMGVDGGSEGLLESGLVVCRRNEKTIALFRDVLESWMGAKEAVNDQVEQIWLTLHVKRLMGVLRVCFLHKRQAVGSRFFQMCVHGRSAWNSGSYGDCCERIMFGGVEVETVMLERRDESGVRCYWTGVEGKSLCGVRFDEAFEGGWVCRVSRRDLIEGIERSRAYREGRIRRVY